MATTSFSSKQVDKGLGNIKKYDVPTARIAFGSVSASESTVTYPILPTPLSALKLGIARGQAVDTNALRKLTFVLSQVQPG